MLRVLGILAMCSAAIWSLRLCIEDIATVPLVVTAMRLESPGYANDFRDDGSMTAAALSSCRSSIVRSAVEVVVATKNNAKSFDDPDAWLTAGQRAEEMISHAVACSPDDGEMWARSAQIASQSTQWETALERLNRSQALAPADEATLSLRVAVWADVPVAVDAESDVSRRADTRAALEHGSPELLRRLLATAPAWMLPSMRDEVARLSVERRQLVVQLAPALGDAAEAPV
jgi:hypothetical protein